jgi:hypothetical protein
MKPLTGVKRNKVDPSETSSEQTMHPIVIFTLVLVSLFCIVTSIHERPPLRRSNPISPLQAQRFRTCQKVKQELITTEEKLQKMTEFLAKPIEAQAFVMAHGYGSAATIARKLVSALQKVVAVLPSTIEYFKTGDFKVTPEMIEAYTAYSRAYPPWKVAYENLNANNAQFQAWQTAFVQYFQNPRNNYGVNDRPQTVDDILIRPVQRTMRYKDLMEVIVKNCYGTGYAEVLTAFKNLAAAGNDVTPELDAFRRTLGYRRHHRDYDEDEYDRPRRDYGRRYREYYY